MSVSSRRPSSIRSPSFFYRLKEVGLHAWGSVRASTSPPVVRGRTVGPPCHRALWGVAQVMSIVLANPSSHARSASLSCGASQWHGDSCRSAQNPMSDEVRHRGCGRPNLALVKSRTAFEGRLPCPLKVLRRGKVQGVGETVAGVSGKSAQSSTVPPRAGNTGTVAGAG